MRIVGVKISPELDEEESVLGSLVKQLLQTPGLLRELVLDLPHVHWLKRENISHLEVKITLKLPQGWDQSNPCSRCVQISVCDTSRVHSGNLRRRNVLTGVTWRWRCSGRSRGRREAPAPGEARGQSARA